MFCVYCGHPVPDGAETCPNCQRPALAPPVPPAQEAAPEPQSAKATASFELPQTRLSIPVPPEESGDDDLAALTASIIQPAAEPPAAPTRAADYTLPELEPTPPPQVLPFDLPPRSQPVPAAAATAGHQAAKSPKTPKEARPRGKVKTWQILVGLAALLLICVAAGVAVLYLTRPAWLPFELPQLPVLAGPKEAPAYLVAYPNRKGENEIFWQDGKDSILLMEDVLQNPSDLRFPVAYQGGQAVYRFWNPAEFIPGSSQVLVRTLDGDDMRVLLVDPGAKEIAPLEIFASDQPYQVSLLEDGTIVIVEFREESKRAYVSRGGAEAERVLKADDLLLVPATQQWIAIDHSSDGESDTYTLVGLEGEEIATLYDGAPVRRHAVSPAGVYLTLVVPVEEGEELVLIDLRAQEEISTLDDYAAFPEVGFADNSDLGWFIAEDEEGWLTLGATLDGEWQILAEGLPQLAVTASADRPWLAYLTMDEDGEESLLYTADVEQGTVQQVYSSDERLMLFSGFPGIPLRFFAEERTSDNEVTLLSFGFDGDDPLVLFNEDQAENMFYRVWSDYLLIEYRMEEKQYLWVCSPYDEDGFLLLEEWEGFTVHDLLPEEKQVLFSAREESDDDPVLYTADLVENADPRELDDSDLSFRSAYFLPDGKSVLYTAKLDFDEDASEVRRALLDGSEAPEVVAEDALLMAVNWQQRDLREYGMLYPVFLQESSGMQTLKTNQVYTLTLAEGEQELQYRVRFEEERLYEVVVRGAANSKNFDPAISTLDMAGEELRTGDYDTGLDESLLFSPWGEGSGLIQIANQLIAAQPVTFDLYIQSTVVLPIQPGQPISGTNSADAYLGAPWSESPFIVDIYGFEAKAGSSYSVTLTGSDEVTHYVYMLDESIGYIGGSFDYVNGSLSFTAEPDEDGWVYLFVSDFGQTDDGKFDPSLDHSYRLTLVLD